MLLHEMTVSIRHSHCRNYIFVYVYLSHNMQGQQFYLKTLTSILVFSFLISYFMFISTTCLLENVEYFSSVSSYQLRRNAAVKAYTSRSNHESLLFNKNVTNPGKYSEKYQKTIVTHQIGRKLLSKKRTTKSKIKREKNCWFDLKKNLTADDILKIDYLNKLKLSKKDLRALEKRTKKQYKCEEWHLERKKRLTASSFGRICKMRVQTPRKNLVDVLLYGTFISNPGTRYGVKFESTAKRALEKVLGKKIRNAGLMVDYDLPYLAASPDGLVARNAIVEIKCPHSARNMTPEDGITSNTIKYCDMINGQLHLKIGSHYYYQVQGQLHITSKLYCYFCVWTPKGMMYQIIKRDDDFWAKSMESQLKTFYLDSLLPELITMV